MSNKQRLSASVDAELLAAAEEAASRGEVRNVSTWVNDALRLKLEHDRRLRGLAAFIAAYEAEHGEITEQDMEEAARRASARAITIRGAARPRRRRAR